MDTSESKNTIKPPEEAADSPPVPDSELETEGLPESPAASVHSIDITPPGSDSEETHTGEPVASSSAAADEEEDEDGAQILRPPPARKTLGPNYAFYIGTCTSTF